MPTARPRDAEGPRPARGLRAVGEAMAAAEARLRAAEAEARAALSSVEAAAAAAVAAAAEAERAAAVDWAVSDELALEAGDVLEEARAIRATRVTHHGCVWAAAAAATAAAAAVACAAASAAAGAAAGRWLPLAVAVPRRQPRVT